MIIDTHTHLDNEAYKNDLDEVIKRAINGDVKGFLIPAASKNDLDRAYKLSKQYKEIFFATGIHPYDHTNFQLNDFEKYIDDPKCIAIGECGLDYFRLPSDKDEQEIEKENQKRVFISQIEYSIKKNKPLIIHIRDASQDSLEILSSYNNIRGVLHCFNADEQLLHLKDNFYYGIGGVVTFKNAKKLVNIIPKIPIDRLILETDSPYLTPHPHRGKRNEPLYIDLVAKKTSEILNIEYEQIKIITLNNSKDLFKEFCQLT